MEKGLESTEESDRIKKWPNHNLYEAKGRLLKREQSRAGKVIESTWKKKYEESYKKFEGTLKELVGKI